MLDADSVFERLVREATNLVPKMSTPKLTAALKASSSLQHRITDTLSARLHQQQGTLYNTEAKSFDMQGIQSIVGGSISSDEIIPDGIFLASSDMHFANRPISSTHYTGIPFSTELNQFAVTQRTATLVTITNPHSGSPSSVSITGPIGSPAALISQSLILAAPPNNIMQQQQQGQSSSAAPMILQRSQQGEEVISGGGCDVVGPATVSSVVTATTNAGATTTTVTDTTPRLADGCPSLGSPSISGPTATFLTNGHIMTVPSSCIEGVDVKPDPVSCLNHNLNNAASMPLFPTTAISNPSVATDLDPSQPSSLGLFPPLTPQVAPDVAEPPTATASASVCMTTQAAASSAAHSRPVPTNGGGGGGGPYRCNHCGKEFRVLRYLEKHRRIHTGEKPYQCCYCGRQFNDWPNMNRHKRIHTGERPYRCSVCNKTFSQPAVYNEHLKRHTGERPYVCAICSKGFPRPARLTVHMRVHTGERPYSCSVCERRFSQPHHLSAHIRIHSGERPFPCPKCEATFGCLANLRRHRRQAHPATTGAVLSTNKNANTNESGAPLQPTDSPQQRILLSASAGLPEGALNASVEAASADTQSSNANDGSMSITEPNDIGMRNAPTDELPSTTLTTLDINSGGGNGAPVSISTVAEALISQAQHLVSVSNGSEEFQILGSVSASTAQLPPQHLYDSTGTIYINAMDGTATGGAMNTTLVPSTSTITSILPQIQIHQTHHQHPQAFAFADPHNLQQSRPIQICYSTSTSGSAGEANPTTIILPQNASMFGQMLVPIGSGGSFSAYTAAPNATAFQPQTVTHVPMNTNQPSQNDALSMAASTPSPSHTVTSTSNEGADAERHRIDV